jgi:hypothetical protein
LAVLKSTRKSTFEASKLIHFRDIREFAFRYYAASNPRLAGEKDWSFDAGNITHNPADLSLNGTGDGSVFLIHALLNHAVQGGYGVGNLRSEFALLC